MAKFSDGVQLHRAKLLAGQHRIAAMEKLLAGTLAQYAKFKEALDTVDATNRESLTKLTKDLHDQLVKGGTWLVHVYNWGEFLRHRPC
jgi:hypothetical protein